MHVSDQVAVLFNVPLVPAISNLRGPQHFQPIPCKASQQLDPLDFSCSVEELATKFVHCAVAPFEMSKPCPTMEVVSLR